MTTVTKKVHIQQVCIKNYINVCNIVWSIITSA